MYHHLLHKTQVHTIPHNYPSVPHSHLNNSKLLKVVVNPLNSLQMDGGGVDSDGRQFGSAEEMWREEVGGQRPPQEITVVLPGRRLLAEKGVEATVDGVLGGYGHVNKPDREGSEAFLNSVLAERFPDAASRFSRIKDFPMLLPEEGVSFLSVLVHSFKNFSTVYNCGSGIGRITKNLLIRYFNEVDLLEPVSHFLDTARRNLAPENLMVTEDYRAVNFFLCSSPVGNLNIVHFNCQKHSKIGNGVVQIIQLTLKSSVIDMDFTPEAGRYDIIWIQWCIGHLSDDDFVSFFNRAKVNRP
ncbi:hypothetical protein ACS0TY_028377 [Phlomoides rotata]